MAELALIRVFQVCILFLLYSITRPQGALSCSSFLELEVVLVKNDSWWFCWDVIQSYEGTVFWDQLAVYKTKNKNQKTPQPKTKNNPWRFLLPRWVFMAWDLIFSSQIKHGAFHLPSSLPCQCWQPSLVSNFFDILNLLIKLASALVLETFLSPLIACGGQ